MALTTKDNVLIIAPELSTVDNTLWDLLLSDVSNHISSSVFGSKTEEAARYWVAHRLTLLNDKSTSNVSGPITKHRVGDVMKEYVRLQSVNSSESDYLRTAYGSTFLSIRKSCVIAFDSVPPGM